MNTPKTTFNCKSKWFFVGTVSGFPGGFVYIVKPAALKLINHRIIIYCFPKRHSITLCKWLLNMNSDHKTFVFL